MKKSYESFYILCCLNPMLSKYYTHLDYALKKSFKKQAQYRAAAEAENAECMCSMRFFDNRVSALM